MARAAPVALAMIRRLLPILLACGLAHNAHAVCTSHECSDDTRGVLGNETLTWDAVPGLVYDDVRGIHDLYEVVREGYVCATVPAMYRTANVALAGCLNEPRPAGNGDIALAVRAYVPEAHDGLWGRSVNLSNAATFRPFTCYGMLPARQCGTAAKPFECHEGCETPCWSPAPRRTDIRPCP